MAPSTLESYWDRYYRGQIIQDQIRRFTRWFEHYGGYIHPAAELAHSFEEGVHLRRKLGANEDLTIPPGTCVISCQHLDTLSAYDTCGLSSQIFGGWYGDDPPIPVLSADLIASAPRPQSLAAVGLCFECSLDATSRYQEYLQLLPSLPASSGQVAIRWMETGEVNSPSWWCNGEKAWIAGSPLIKGIEDLDNIWKEEWEKWGSKVAVYAASEGWNLTWLLYKWSLTILNARAFSSSQLSEARLWDDGLPVLSKYDPEVLLYPGMDMLNHSAHTRNSWRCDEDSFSIICNDDVEPGGQIYNSYGAKNNGQLLLSYGFSIANNPHDAVPLKLPSRDYPQLDQLEARSLTPYPDKTITNDPGKDQQPSKIQEAHDPSCTTFYIRRPQIAVSTHDHRRPGYPIGGNLSGLPFALTDRLRCLVSNKREIYLASKRLEDETYQCITLQYLLGLRNSLATTSLLLDRLVMDRDRLSQGLGNIERGYLNIEQRESTHQRTSRLNAAKVYMTGQEAILSSNIEALRSKIFDALCSENVLTLQQALKWLWRYISEDTWFSFVHGIAFVYGHELETPHDMTDEEWGVQEILSWFEYGQEELWTLWLGAFLKTDTHAKHDERDIAVRTRVDRWHKAVQATYVHLPEGEDQQSEERVQDLLRSTHVAWMRHRERVPDSAGEHQNAWEGTVWTKESLQSLVRIVGEESVVLPLLDESEGSQTTRRCVVLVIEDTT